MIAQIAQRLLRETDPALLARFLYNFAWKGAVAVRKFHKRLEQGRTFPAFVMLSITDRCNLECQGCWVSQTGTPHYLALEEMDRIVAACKRQGSFFFGLLGGEPLLHPHLFDFLAKHRRCYFQIFTNGTLLTADVARELRRLGNATPLVSVEGNAETSDVRRGGTGVYARAMRGLEQCRKYRLITGVASSVCRSNFGDVVADGFVRDMIARGAHYLWYYIYRPAGVNPCPELALSAEEIAALRRFTVDIRTKAPILVVDAYWDHLGRALCPAAVGMSHHINPSGDVEFCPPIQFGCGNIRSDPLEIVFDSPFLRRFREFAGQSKGCVLLNRPRALKEFLEGARDTSGRGTALLELGRMLPHPCHHTVEIPERHWAYRFAKKFWFFGFGAYG